MLRLALLLVMLAPQDVAWRTNWKETLAEEDVPKLVSSDGEPCAHS